MNAVTEFDGLDRRAVRKVRVVDPHPYKYTDHHRNPDQGRFFRWP
jgi:hypothetical protein